MLVLTRRENQTIILETADGPIEIKLTDIDGAQVRIGIRAPRSVGIVRGELKERDRTEKK
jgi:carbon storage regulator